MTVCARENGAGSGGGARARARSPSLARERRRSLEQLALQPRGCATHPRDPGYQRRHGGARRDESHPPRCTRSASVLSPLVAARTQVVGERQEGGVAALGALLGVVERYHERQARASHQHARRARLGVELVVARADDCVALALNVHPVRVHQRVVVCTKRRWSTPGRRWGARARDVDCESQDVSASATALQRRMTGVTRSAAIAGRPVLPPEPRRYAPRPFTRSFASSGVTPTPALVAHGCPSPRPQMHARLTFPPSRSWSLRFDGDDGASAPRRRALSASERERERTRERRRSAASVPLSRPRTCKPASSSFCAMPGGKEACAESPRSCDRRAR